MKSKMELKEGNVTELRGNSLELINGIEYLKPELNEDQNIALKCIHDKVRKYKLSHFPLDKVSEPGDTVVVPTMKNTILRPGMAMTLNTRDFPDWIVEIATKEDAEITYFLKPSLLREANVKEYWIIDTDLKTVVVYSFLKNAYIPKIYSTKQRIKVSIYPDLFIPYTELFPEKQENAS